MTDTQQQFEVPGEDAANAAWQAHQIMNGLGYGGTRLRVSRWRLHPETLRHVRAFARDASGRYIVVASLNIGEDETMLSAPFVADETVPRGTCIAEVVAR